MPSWKIHRLLDKLILGKEHKDVHEFLDIPGTLLNNGNIFGHRKYWGHTYDYVILVYLLSKDTDKTLSAWLHLIADKKVKYKDSKLIEYVLREILQDSKRSRK